MYECVKTIEGTNIAMTKRF